MNKSDWKAIWVNKMMNGIADVQNMIPYLLLSLFIGILVDMLLAKIISKEHIPKTFLLNMVITFVFLWIGGYTAQTLSKILLCQILLFASVYDLATHTVPDYVHILIAIVGLINFDFFPALVGLVIVGLPLFIAAIVKDDMIGGGDVKLMAVIGFAVGVNKGFTTLVLGLFFAVVFGSHFNRVKNKNRNEPLALIPYFSLGCAMVLL